MLHSKSNNRIKNKQLFPCLSGQEIANLKPIKNIIEEIHKLISCPSKIYGEIYLPVLYQLAEFCQATPFSKEEDYYSYELLKRQLTIALTALKLRRGILLPKNTGAEVIAAEEARWTYALFTISLLSDIDAIQKDREVTLCYVNGETIDQWEPISGCLYEKNAYYKITFTNVNSIHKESTFMAALIGRIVPPVAIRWLRENASLYKLWWGTILHETIENNILDKMIQEAKSKLGILQDNLNIKINRFFEWLAKLIEENNFNVFRVSKGLFVEDKLIDNFCKNNRSINQQSFIQILNNNNTLVANDVSYTHSLSPVKFENRHVLKGIILNTLALPDVLKTLPLNQQYQDSLAL